MITIVIPKWVAISMLVLMFLDCINWEFIKVLFPKKKKCSDSVKEIQCNLTFKVPKCVRNDDIMEWLKYNLG